MGWESPRPNIQGFQGKADLPWGSRDLRGGREAYTMGNRSIFLYLCGTEHAGTRRRGPCRERKDRYKRGSRQAGKSACGRQYRDVERRRSSEAGGGAVEKSRYCSHKARTVNRHRWMGRGSQGRRKKHCQGTRQNGPVTSGEGAPAARRAAGKRPRQLFSKNTGLCETGR